MKRLLICLALLSGGASAQIVNNSGSTASDSISVPFYILDSAGNMTATTTNDSLFLIFFYPSGAEAFRDTVAHGNSLITTVTVAGYSVYSWKLAVADIDGSGKDGLYSYIVWVKDHTAAALATPHKGYFQLYQAHDYNVWASRIIDSLQAVIDTLQLLDNWAARDATVLKPTVAGRTLDVTSGGNAGIDWGNIENPSSPSDPRVTVGVMNADVVTSAALDQTAREEIWNAPFTGGAVAAGSMWDSLNNKSYAANPAGGFIDSNKSEQGGISGANRTWNVYVFDTSGTDTPIPSANVDVQLSNGTVKSRGTTNASGLTTFTVTDGGWVLVSQETGYVLNNLSKTISGNSTDTVKGFDITVGTPSSPALCRVYGYVYSVGAVPDNGAGVAAFLPSGVARSGNLIISPFSVSTITDSLGYFYLDLIRSDSLLPVGTKYDFIINRKDGTIVHKRITVPNQTSWPVEW